MHAINPKNTTIVYFSRFDFKTQVFFLKKKIILLSHDWPCPLKKKISHISCASIMVDTPVSAQEALAKATDEFFEMYDKFVQDLSQVFGNASNPDDPLERARLNIATIMTAVDQDDRVRLLATRWNTMATVAKNKQALDSKNEAHFMANLEGPSIFSELGMPQILASERFAANRPFFWAFVKKLTKKAQTVVTLMKTANAAPADLNMLERDAAMASTLEDMGLMVRRTNTGELTLDIKQLMDPAKAKKIFSKVMKSQKGDTTIMNSALETVKSMMSGGEESEKALSALLSQGK